MGDKPLDKIKKVLWHLDEALASVALVCIVIFVTINVFCRYVLGYIFNWMEEAATMAFVWCAFMGISSAYKTNDHVGINVIVTLLPKQVQRIIMILVNVFNLVVSAIIFKLSITFCISSWSKLSPIMGIPYTFINVSVLISFGLMIITTVFKIIELIKCKAEDVTV